MTRWTEEADEELRRHLKAGETCGNTAKLMGVSRNAVIGRARRLGVRSNFEPTAKKQNGGRPRIHPVVKNIAPPPPAILLPTLGIKMLDLEPHHCRFPYGDPQQPDFSFCGHPRHGENPYCAAHCAIAFVAPHRFARMGFDYHAAPKEEPEGDLVQIIGEAA